jgi:hypothetical protein
LQTQIVVAAALVVLSLSGSAQSQRMRYEPGNPRYEITQTSSASMDGLTENEAIVFARVDLAVAPERGDTLKVVVEVDSLTNTTDGKSRVMLPRGARTVMRLLGSGKLVGNTSDEDVLGGILSEVFVTLPAEGRIGASVADTTVETAEEMEELGMDSIRMVVNSRIAADTTVDGTAAWKVELSGNMVPVQKDSTMAMGSMKMSVTGDVQGTAYMSKSGTLLMINRRWNIALNMELSLMGN